MIHYFNGADEIIREIPKNHASPFRENEKYYRKITGYDGGGNPEYDSAINNSSWIDSSSLKAYKEELRTVRDEKLVETDYIYLRQKEQDELESAGKGSKNKKKLNASKYESVIEYRQDLRNIISDISDWQDIKDLSWPNKPDTTTE